MSNSAPELLGSIFVRNIYTAHWVIVGTGLFNVETSLAELGELLLLTSSPRPLNIEGARDTMHMSDVPPAIGDTRSQKSTPNQSIVDFAPVQLRLEGNPAIDFGALGGPGPGYWSAPHHFFASGGQLPATLTHLQQFT